MSFFSQISLWEYELLVNPCSKAYTLAKLLKRVAISEDVTILTPTTSIYTEWSKKAAEAYLTTGWGEGTITEFKLEYLYGPEPEVSGE
jgi:hypothetical protein